MTKTNFISKAAEGTKRSIRRVAARQDVIRSSGNVFADMSLPDAAELGTKARLGAALNLIMQKSRITSAEIATALGVEQREVSDLLHSRLEGFSIDRLKQLLEALGQGTDPLDESAQ